VEIEVRMRKRLWRIHFEVLETCDFKNYQLMKSAVKVTLSPF
jgi:hypothetical protein